MEDYDFYKLDDCSLYQLNVCDAASLVIFDLVHEGAPLGWEPVDKLLEALSETETDELANSAHKNFRSVRDFPRVAGCQQKLEDLLCEGIDSGELKTALKRRLFDKKINCKKTFLKAHKLEQWLADRGYEVGEGFQRYFQWESDIHSRIESVVKWERYDLKDKMIQEIKHLEYTDPSQISEYFMERAFTLEREKKEWVTSIADDQKEPSSKSRNSYLRTIDALANALIKGRTGKPHLDAQATLNAMQAAAIDSPIDERTLANYLKEADKLAD